MEMIAPIMRDGDPK